MISPSSWICSGVDVLAIVGTIVGVTVAGNHSIVGVGDDVAVEVLGIIT
jgi:hypothetical protein